MMQHYVNKDTNNISFEVRDCLKKCGVSNKLIRNCTRKTRLLHDLNIYGDVAESLIEILEKDHGVNILYFDFQKYFPEEFFGENLIKKILFRVIPLTIIIEKRKSKYNPLTLAQIENAIKNKFLT